MKVNGKQPDACIYATRIHMHPYFINGKNDFHSAVQLSTVITKNLTGEHKTDKKGIVCCHIPTTTVKRCCMSVARHLMYYMASTESTWSMWHDVQGEKSELYIGSQN